MPDRSSERVNANRRPSTAKRRPYAFSPTTSAVWRPVPATTHDPENSVSPGSFATGSASPVRSDSSTSKPSDCSTGPSTTIWSPRRTSTRSPSTTSRDGTARVVPERITVAVVPPTTTRRSSVRFARSSCTTPTAALLTNTMPNNASCGGPTMRMTTSSEPNSALNLVTMFARRIADTRPARRILDDVGPSGGRSRPARLLLLETDHLGDRGRRHRRQCTRRPPGHAPLTSAARGNEHHRAVGVVQAVQARRSDEQRLEPTRPREPTTRRSASSDASTSAGPDASLIGCSVNDEGRTLRRPRPGRPCRT